MCLRILVCLPALASVLMGIFAILFPTWLSMGNQFNFNALDPQSTYMVWPLYVYWIIGSLLIIMGVSLCACASRLDSMASRYTGLILAALLLGFVILVIVSRETMHKQVDQAVKALQSDYISGNKIQTRGVMDGMQQWMRCCGSDYPTAAKSVFEDDGDAHEKGFQSWLAYQCIPRSCLRDTEGFLPEALAATCETGIGPINSNKILLGAATVVNTVAGWAGAKIDFDKVIFTTSCTYRLSWAVWVVLVFIALLGIMMLMSFICLRICCRRRMERHEDVKYSSVQRRYV